MGRVRFDPIYGWVSVGRACGPQVHVYGAPGEAVECRLAHTGQDHEVVGAVGAGLVLVGVAVALVVRWLDRRAA